MLRGEDLFRGSVIVALGDYGGTYALEELTTVARLDGPLQDDAVTALARLGSPSSRAVIAGLQKEAAASCSRRSRPPCACCRSIVRPA